MIKRNGIEESEKNIKEGGKGKKNGKRLVAVLMAAMIMMAAMTALVPIAAAGVTSFTIDPYTDTAGATSAYNIILNTTGFTSLNITIPAGFEAVEPTETGDEIGRAYFWDSTGKNWTLVFTAGSPASTQVEVVGYNETGASSGVEIGFTINYNPGGGANIPSPWDPSGPPYANLTLPIGTTSGSLNISMPGSVTITNVTVSIGEFVKNPADADDYDFVARADGEAVGVTETVTVTPGVVTVEIPLQGGWNMVSLPIDPTDPSVDSVFAGVNRFGKSVYTFDGSTYVSVTTVEPKKGYWVFSVGSVTITVPGSSITNTIDFQGGWNMIGLPVTPTDPSVDSVFAGVNRFGKSVYTFDGSTYVSVTTVEPKKGYWVFSVGSVTITVPGSPVTD